MTREELLFRAGDVLNWIPDPRNPAEVSELMVKLIRQIGVKRIRYGSDAATGNNLAPRESWEAFRQLKLSKKELETIARNIAPYFR